MYNIRLYNESKDLEMIQNWCATYQEVAPTLETIPPASSYILEMDSTPALFLSLIKTNASFCYLENFCGNPEFKGKRAAAVPHFISFMEETAKEAGYKLLVTASYKPKLVSLFQTYGFTPTVALIAMSRRIA